MDGLLQSKLINFMSTFVELLIIMSTPCQNTSVMTIPSNNLKNNSTQQIYYRRISYLLTPFLRGLKNQKVGYEVLNHDQQSLAEAQRLAEAHKHNLN